MNNDRATGERIAIIGAGISGLTLGWLLSKLGERVTIFEAANCIGGLSRTFEWHGVPCDIAPHRLYTHDQRALDALRSLVPLRQFRRHSRILMHGRQIRDPINPLELLLRFPPRVGISLVRGFLNRPGLEEDSFESLALNRYGQGLYDFFFEPYTRKMFGVSPREISVTWGREKLRSSNLFDTIRRGSKTFFRSFWYPREGGYGAIGDAMRKHIRGDVLLEAPVTGLEFSGDRIESVRYLGGSQELRFECDRLFSTIPATRLASFLGEKLDLRYRNIQLVYLNVSKPNVMPYHWVYFGDGDVVINRMAEFKHFHPDWPETPNSVLCAEVTVGTERPEDDVLSALRRYDLLDADDVLDTMVLPERYGYPVYDRGFERVKERADLLFSRYANLHCVGRNAEFRHIEVDEDLLSAIDCVKQLYGTAF
jgi:protoporphyrinogen oxidase